MDNAKYIISKHLEFFNAETKTKQLLEQTPGSEKPEMARGITDDNAIQYMRNSCLRSSEYLE